ncbi:MAG: hypothetical protein G01um101470_790 [Parcubacteria group bacterium Gr01-1014_70]|nr:MAG: hypothetical protein G01um101470_790 [Parcubacteria group bacterium Gr01-1014_70]
MVEKVDVSPSTMRRVRQLARRDRCTPTDVLEAALNQYESDMEKLRRIQQVGKKSARRGNIRSMVDIDRIVHEVRKKRASRRS